MWFAYGDFVIDRLLGVSRSTWVDVFFDAPPFNAPEVRESISANDHLQVIAVNEEPRLVCNLDKFVIGKEGKLLDRSDGFVEIGKVPKSLELRLTQCDLTAEETLRLLRWADIYPELTLQPHLKGKLTADAEFLQETAWEFPGITEVIEKYIPS